ncbi:MAG TPA: putative Ig domain-containing protein [bacterium]|nr:putative Ig domain-containing protein [bacterium]HOL35860.1 putative Ig domain-containing protein [bacterium]
MKIVFLFLGLLVAFCAPLFPWSYNISSPTVICDREESQNQLQLIKTNDGNFIILWVDERRGIVPGFSWKFRDIYGQKINSSGEIQWQEDGIPIVEGYGEGVVFERQCDVRVASDGDNGAIFSWTDASGGNIQGNNVRINRIDEDGNKLWGPGGMLLQNGDSGGNESISSDGQGGVFAVWNYGGYRLWYPRAKASHIGGNGNVIATMDSISSKGGDDGEGSAIAGPVVKMSSSGTSLLGWEDSRDGSYYGWRSLRVQKFSEGPEWTLGGVRVSLPNNNIDNIVSYCDIVSDGSGGLIAFWSDNRNGNKDIFAQRVDSSGNIVWQEGGIPTCTAQGEQGNLQAVSDNSNGAIVVWVDTRSGTSQIYAQRISQDGTILWQENGVLIGNGTTPLIINSLNGNYFIFWKKSDKIYAQKIGNDGVGWWQDGGVQVSDSNFDELKAASDVDGAVVIWTNGNIYAQKLFNNGTVDINSPLTITTGKDLPTGALEKNYNTRIGAIGGNGNRYTWQIIEGKLPQGLSFDESTGLISGTPIQLGMFNFTVSASDGTSTDTQQLRLFIQIDTGMEIFYDYDWPAIAKGSSYLLVTRQSTSVWTPSYLYCQFLDNNGYKIGSKFTVYENDWVDQADVAYNPVNDKYLIVFMGGEYIPNNPNYHLYGIFIDGSTHQSGSPFIIKTEPYRNPSVRVNSSNGDYLIVANEDKGGGKWIGIILDKDGNFKAQFDIGQEDQWPQSCSIAYNPSENNFLVTYTYLTMKYVWGRIVASDGGLGSERTLATSPNNNALANCRVTYNANVNKFVLAYSLSYPSSVFARCINSNGEPSGGAFYISKTLLQEAWAANVAVSLSGKTCVFWTSSADEYGNYDSNNQYIYVQRITESGPEYEKDELITPCAGLKRNPVAVVGNTDNNFLVMWKTWEGSRYKVYGIFYNLPQASGDLNSDDKVDISDAILCLRQAIGLDPQDIEAADMNGDDQVDISDVILILRKAIGLE